MAFREGLLRLASACSMPGSSNRIMSVILPAGQGFMPAQHRGLHDQADEQHAATATAPQEAQQPAQQQQPLASLSSAIPKPGQPQSQPIGKPDPFTQAMQSKVSAQLLSMMQQRQPAAAGSEAKHAPDGSGSESDEETSEYVNPQTGERGGYKGKEPTTYGDWAHKGRCTDF